VNTHKAKNVKTYQNELIITLLNRSLYVYAANMTTPRTINNSIAIKTDVL
jgi:hypothetical protein